MKVRANTADVGWGIFLAGWQVAVLPSALRSWTAGSRLSAVLDVLAPTVQLWINLMFAAKARGHSFAWGVSAVLGVVGIAIIYRWPLRVLPEDTDDPGPGFQPNGLAIVFPVVQVILVFHAALTYPWDSKPHEWVGDLFLYLLVSAFMLAWVGQAATNRGYHRCLGALGLLGPIGLAIIYGVPDRTIQPARGFPIEPN